MVKFEPNTVISGIFFICFLLSLKPGIFGQILKVRIDGEEVDLGIPGIRGPDPNITDEDAYLHNDSDFTQREIKKRLKRSPKRRGPSMTYDRRGPKCFERIKHMRQANKMQSHQEALLVEIGGTVKMTCHFCQDSTRETMKPMNWYKLRRKGHPRAGRYRFDEMGVSMHDKDSKNRISKTVDHTLIIKKTTEADIGSYVCHDFTKSDMMLEYTFDNNFMEDVAADISQFRFIYYLDVMRPAKMKVRLVSLTDPSKPKPRPPDTIAILNAILSSQWQEWSKCSRCGKTGERKRLGLCVAKKDDKWFKSKPFYLEAVMSTSPDGVPCQSTIFNRKLPVNFRPNELMREKCKVKCKVKKIPKAMKVSGMNNVIFGKKKLGFSGASLTVALGRELKLICPGSNIDTVVTWFHKGDPLLAIDLANKTGGRMSINAHNVLSIKSVRTKDSGKYKCVLDHNHEIIITLAVYIDNKEEFWEYNSYVLATYPLNFIIFLILVIIKHRQYKVGVRLTKKKQKLLEGMSSSETSDTDKNDF